MIYSCFNYSSNYTPEFEYNQAININVDVERTETEESYKAE